MIEWFDIPFGQICQLVMPSKSEFLAHSKHWCLFSRKDNMIDDISLIP